VQRFRNKGTELLASENPRLRDLISGWEISGDDGKYYETELKESSDKDPRWLLEALKKNWFTSRIYSNLAL
jgi:hypothetical protein